MGTSILAHSKVVLNVILALRGIGLGFHAFNAPLAHPVAVAIVFARSNDQPAASYQVRLATLWTFGGTAVVAAFLLRESLVWLIGRDHVEKTEESVTAKTGGTGGGGGGDSGDRNMLWWIWTVLAGGTGITGITARSVGSRPLNLFGLCMYNTDEANWGDKVNFIVAGLGVVAFVAM
ncbi:maltose permease [Colletotrichum tabaci]|uniref:Maltose permease n=1 Tax=Colletotrichum tabaci TaxID=1209068 RepID=A0AAV9TDV0_9PEZI